MNSVKFTLSIIFGFVFSILTHGQELKGTISSTEGDPIIGGHLICNSKNIHTHTDINGNFRFSGIEVGDTLEISHIGYASKSKVLTDQDFKNPIEIKIDEDIFSLEQVSISNEMRSAYKVSNIDLILNPVSSSQQVLRSVPGLFIGQHAGGGKAEQIFLRGFDIDHGTDITLSVDGMPVNMVSHAHGQGYADLHFVIPETIDQIDFGKGPYYADQGNFNTAGYVDFKTKDRVKESKIGIEYGRFNTKRMFGIVSLFNQSKSKNSAYIATEYLLTDGPFESEQNFNRFNLMGKFVANLSNNDRLEMQFSRFQSRWDASGQIPQRLVESDSLTRFGAVDDTEGGETSRSSASIAFTKNISSNSFLKFRSYYIQYDFELFSNFTFFLDDPINGDQIRQSEKRQIYGVESKLHQSFFFDDFDIDISSAIGMRYDDINDNQLSYTTNRKELRERLSFGDVDESNIYAFTNANFEFGKWVINPGVRLDYFDFNYIDNLQNVYSSESENTYLVSPKLNFIYNPNRSLQLFLKSGFGFHSNDSRVVIAQAGVETLPKAFGLDLGSVWKPHSKVWLTGALWQLYLQQEFVYVGDEAIVEPSGRTMRRGIEFGARFQLTDALFLDADGTFTHASSLDSEDGADRIPLAPKVTATGGISYQNNEGLSGSLRYRYIMDRPANETNSIVAQGYFILDGNLTYKFNRIRVGISVENLLNSEWNEAQFATESRTQFETEPTEELHFTPGSPFAVRSSISYSF